MVAGLGIVIMALGIYLYLGAWTPRPGFLKDCNHKLGAMCHILP